MPSLEAAVSWAEAVAADPAHGYSQSDRDGTNFDCSSLVCRALRAAGFGTPGPPSFNTRTMGSWLTAHGWAWHGGTAGVRRGDVLWKTGHTGLAASGSTAVEARIDERGGVAGGRPGDQTGDEIGVFAIASTAWAGYWRYEGESEEEVTDKDVDRIAQRVWEVSQGRWTADRVYRCTSMLKAMCGLGAEDTTDPKAVAGDIRAWTMGRWERALRILKGMVGIGQEDTGDGAIATPMHVSLSDEQMANLADMVAERLRDDG